MDFEDFCQGYMVCALWSSSDDDGKPLDDSFDTSDISESAIETMRNDCQKFYNENLLKMSATNSDFSQHGHDFWLTRNGHGAGFWDRSYGDDGDLLTDATKAFGEAHIYVGDDGKLHC